MIIDSVWWLSFLYYLCRIQIESITAHRAGGCVAQRFVYRAWEMGVFHALFSKMFFLFICKLFLPPLL